MWSDHTYHSLKNVFGKNKSNVNRSMITCCLSWCLVICPNEKRLYCVVRLNILVTILQKTRVCACLFFFWGRTCVSRPLICLLTCTRIQTQHQKLHTFFKFDIYLQLIYNCWGTFLGATIHQVCCELRIKVRHDEDVR